MPRLIWIADQGWDHTCKEPCRSTTHTFLSHASDHLLEYCKRSHVVKLNNMRSIGLWMIRHSWLLDKLSSIGFLTTVDSHFLAAMHVKLILLFQPKPLRLELEFLLSALLFAFLRLEFLCLSTGMFGVHIRQILTASTSRQLWTHLCLVLGAQRRLI